MTDTIAAPSRGSLVDIHGFNGAVIALFPGSIYIAPDMVGNDMLVVHDAAHGHTPTSVHVDRRNLTAVAPGDRVAGRAGHLRVGPIVIDIRASRIWQPVVASPSNVPMTTMQRFADLCRTRRLGSCDLDDSVATLLGALNGTGHGCRSAAVGAALARIIGRGPGLTPSGDDVMVGMLAVLHRATSPTVSTPMIDELSRALPGLLGRTTPISAHYLRLAVRGAFTERLVELVDTLRNETMPHDALVKAFDDVLATGATSGADALGGIDLTMRMLATRFSELENVA
ncbi:MAG TPA: DUF2877 domain-containing protein [Ilumatobacteraceae bacterium]|nr:DUF2877 domain-containing protein [Ilumatobacteraceae bacterium]